MNWQAIGIIFAVLFGLVGAVVGLWTLRLAMKRHDAQHAIEDIDLVRKRDELEQLAAMRTAGYYAAALESANQDLERMRRRISDLEIAREHDKEEWQEAIETEREARQKDNEECDRKLAASRTEREAQIATLNEEIGKLHERIGRLMSSV